MIMKMENEMKYVAPEVEVLEVEIEKGFGASDGSNADVEINPGTPTD